jgi:hypothetical protein
VWFTFALLKTKGMKIFILLILTVFLFSNCKKKVKNTFDTTGQTLLSESSFSGGGGHSTSGTVKLYEKNGTKSLVFTNFNTNNGPDVNVYFSNTSTLTDSDLVGDLKATSGNFYYTLSSFNANKRTVVLWCDQANVLFGTAVLP